MSKGWGWGGGVLWFTGRHCVRSIPKMKNTTTTTTATAAIDTNGNKKQFPPKRCGVGAPRHRPARESMRWGSCQLAPVLKAAEGGFIKKTRGKTHVTDVGNNMSVRKHKLRSAELRGRGELICGGSWFMPEMKSFSKEPKQAKTFKTQTVRIETDSRIYKTQRETCRSPKLQNWLDV